MFEINIDSSSPRISLARAAQLTGYHQDYLGQLCRLGKLQATKIGRNWFTSAEALNELGTPANNQDMYGNVYGEYNSTEDEQGLEAVISPVIAQNVTVEKIEDLPISIQPVPATTRVNNNVQDLLTGLRIENLQKEVLELRRLLFALMEEVKSHTSILQARETVSRVEDSLKHSYVSNFDFNLSEERNRRPEQVEIMTQPILRIEPALSRRYALTDWLAVAISLLIASFISVGIATGTFFGSQPQQQSYYYHTPSEVQPAVAGAESLPTGSAGELPTDVVQ